MEIAAVAAIGAVALLVLLTVTFLIRLRVLAGRVGSFECALRLPGSRRWTSGIATFGDEAIEWNRLVSLGWRPRYRLVRDEIDLGGVRHRGRSRRVVDVECRYRGLEFELAMLEDSHSALVAWLESAAPTQPTLF